MSASDKKAESPLVLAARLLAGRDVEAAVSAFNMAEDAGADAGECSAGRWMAAMLRGDMHGAWRESDVLRRMGAQDPHRFWDGMPLKGKRVIVRCLHGLGDAVQMMRYAPWLRAMAFHVIYEVPPRMVPLARCLEGVDEVVTWGDEAPVVPPPWDSQVEIMELPYLFRTSVIDLPIAEGYLKVPQEMIATVGERMGVPGGRRVGLVWTAGEWNPSRSLAPGWLEDLLGVEHVEFWSLQHNGQPLAGMADGMGVCGDGLLPLSALIANLDLVITVDTLAAHLAGAMGKQVWVMLQYAADWRWMSGRSDSPWYPTMRLFRQATPGGWQSVVEQVAEALRHER